MRNIERKYWLDNPRHVRCIVWALAAACAALAAADFFHLKHTHFDWQGWFAFDAFFGFLSFCLIVLSGWPLGKLLRRNEDYYDR